MPGVLRGTDLAAAFADMDAFVFPSLTDTFGLVVLEAMASAVPVVLNPETGARIGVREGVDGFLTNDLSGGVLRLMRNEPLRRSMANAARGSAASMDWSGVFEEMYDTYSEALTNPEVLARVQRAQLKA